MILARPFHSQIQRQPSTYPTTSSRPSPLSERSANVVPCAFSFNFNMAAQDERNTKISQRPFKPNPIMQRAGASRDAQAQRRRDMFFRRVQEDRDNKKWETRGEQIQRLDFMSEQKRWQAEKAREAPREAPREADLVDEEILEDATSSYALNRGPQEEISEADYILAQEEHELQQLIASMEVEQETLSQHYGSDDEDYDRIFIECATTADALQRSNPANAEFQDADAMDVS